MERYQNKYRTESSRLQDRDRSAPAWYYVTICTDQRRYYFGDLSEGDSCVRLTTLGRVADEFFIQIPDHFPFVTIKAHVIMPNHVHGLMRVDGPAFSEKKTNSFGSQSKDFASAVRGFKGAVQTFATLNRMPFKWQPSYHCNVVKSEKRVEIISNHIKSNPAKWIEKMKTYKTLKARERFGAETHDYAVYGDM
ncbi:MAG TPA: transposase [Chryseosolibacter sp.]